jgi:hypothetical protein
VVGRVAFLPEPQTPVPREKPLPAQKEKTKWEKFAAEKGIVKRKKSRSANNSPACLGARSLACWFGWLAWLYDVFWLYRCVLRDSHNTTT